MNQQRVFLEKRLLGQADLATNRLVQEAALRWRDALDDVDLVIDELGACADNIVDLAPEGYYPRPSQLRALLLMKEGRTTEAQRALRGSAAMINRRAGTPGSPDVKATTVRANDALQRCAKATLDTLRGDRVAGLIELKRTSRLDWMTREPRLKAFVLNLYSRSLLGRNTTSTQIAAAQIRQRLDKMPPPVTGGMFLPGLWDHVLSVGDVPEDATGRDLGATTSAQFADAPGRAVVTAPEFYDFQMEELVGGIYVDLIRGARRVVGSRRAVYGILGWRKSRVAPFLRTKPRRHYGGPVVLEVSLKDLKGLTYIDSKGGLERVLMRAFDRMEPGWSNYEIERFLGVDEKKVRRLRGPAKNQAQTDLLDRFDSQ